MNLKYYQEIVLDLLFPKECLGCTKAGSYLCSECLAGIKGNIGQFSEFLEPNYLDEVRIAADYNNPLLRKAIHCLKYKFVSCLGRDLAGLVNKELISGLEDYLVVPIPLAKKRMKLREFNQAEVVAEAISNKFGLKINNGSLVRMKHAQAQMSLGREQRIKNIKNIFNVRGDGLKDFNKILLIDDVLTTSATLNEAARVLKRAGVKKVVAIVLAHGN